MASLSLPIEVADSRQPAADSQPASVTTLVAGFGDARAQDFAAGSPTRQYLDLTKSDVEIPRHDALVLFLPRTNRDRHLIDSVLERAALAMPTQVVIVSTFAADLGDAASAACQKRAAERMRSSGANVAIFRAGFMMKSEPCAFAAFYPLIPRRLASCFLHAKELHAAIERELANCQSGLRIFSLWGKQRPWREVMRERRGRGLLSGAITAISYMLSWLLVGQIGAILFDLLTRWRPALRARSMGVVTPGSMRELLTIYNKYNFRHVKIVGYNNGVNHFGHKYPGKTIVSTVGIHRVKMARPDVLKADGGATVRQALDLLAGAGRELPVVPNYSYVCLGTAFFVPIHGSAADFSTIAETITRAVLYDPQRDRILSVGSDEPEFRDNVYNLQADVLVLRLYLRVKPKARYFIQRETLPAPGGADLLAALRDPRPTNVEIRKASAAATEASVCRFYNDSAAASGDALELPRDSLGRLWDRLEENAVTSWLMHAFARYCVWHVELFFTADEFVTFWHTHQNLPIKKIQVRYIRRDGLPHSPFREHDCMSVDLFMLRHHRQEFEAYLARTFTIVRSNPGKHSR
ncbi:MAG TPA: hypothetical protein VFE62_26455 [Gemmataceae bacterium]|nr:hypothetical protein [Gemmataceae bacterium]